MPVMRAILVLAILLLQDAGTTRPPTPDPITLAIDHNCEWISRARPELVPVAQACEAAYQMKDSMPNFVCDLKVKRAQVVPPRVVPSATFPRRTDIVTAEVTYLNGKEEFGDVRINNKPADNAEALHASNWTSGEFSPPALIVLAGRSIPTFTFHDEKIVAHAPRLDFDYSVPQQNSSWRWTFFGRSYRPAFHGSLSIDKQTGFVRNFTMIADGLPSDVPYSRVTVSTDYDSVAITGLGVYQLPVRAVITACQRGFRDCDQNVKEFFACRRFAAKARIITNP
jgi:hypothetical protein